MVCPLFAEFSCFIFDTLWRSASAPTDARFVATMHRSEDAYKDVSGARELGLTEDQMRNGANFRVNITDEAAKRRPGDNRALDIDRPPSEGSEGAFVEEEAFEVGMRQNMMDFTAHDVDQTETLDFHQFCALIRDREAGEHKPKELRKRFDAMDLNRNGKIEMNEYLMFSLRDVLSRSVTRVLDLLQAWDDDGSGDIGKKEFRRAIKALGFDDIRDSEIDKCFDELDSDASGRIDYLELTKKIRQFTGPWGGGTSKLRRGAVGRKGAVLSASVQIDYNSQYSVAHQLKLVLKENSVRIVDLFREWDEDGDGTISRSEFAKVMPVLGIKVSKQDMDELFSMFDPDGSGLIDYSELNNLLRQEITDPIKLAFNPWVARQVREKLRKLDDTDSFALCMHTTSALSVRGCRSLPMIDQRRAANGLGLDEAHRLWMQPMKGNLWRATKTGGLPPLDFSSYSTTTTSAARPRRPRPPSLIKIKAMPRTLDPLTGIYAGSVTAR